MFGEPEDSKGRTAPTTMTPKETHAGAGEDESAGPPGRSFGEGIVSEKPLDEVILNYLVENARKRKRLKHGGEFHRVELVDLLDDAGSDDVDLLALDEALVRLEDRWPEKAKLVKLRFFTGLTIPEAAKAMGISHATAERHWAFARTWLYQQLKA